METAVGVGGMVVFGSYAAVACPVGLGLGTAGAAPSAGLSVAAGGAVCGIGVAGVLGSYVLLAEGLKNAAEGTQKQGTKRKSQSNPLQGEPNSSSTTRTPKGELKQTREYGPDGNPKRDIDYDHDHGQGKPHVHEWKTVPSKQKPSKLDRGSGRSFYEK